MSDDTWQTTDPMGTYTTVNESGVPINDGDYYTVLRQSWSEDWSVRTIHEVQVYGNQPPRKAANG